MEAPGQDPEPAVTQLPLPNHSEPDRAAKPGFKNIGEGSSGSYTEQHHVRDRELKAPCLFPQDHFLEPAPWPGTRVYCVHMKSEFSSVENNSPEADTHATCEALLSWPT